MINGKEVFHVNVPGVNDNNEYSVVLTGIPEEGFFDELSVIAYVEENSQKVFVEAPIARSVARVALKMANNGFNVSNIDGIDEILSTSKKKVAYNAFDKLEVSSGLYELNHFNLGREFLKDWNEFFYLNLEDLDATNFYASAKEGTLDEDSVNDNLANLNIYKFFNDSLYKVKWGWLLDYLASVDGTTHTTRQIEAVKGVGTNADYKLYNGTHLSHSLTNFFNQEHEIGNYKAINFTEVNLYETLKDFNNKVYIDLAKYDLYDVGQKIRAPKAPSGAEEGYQFSNYKAGKDNIEPEALYVIDGNVVFEEVYTPINYDVKFYDGDNELTELRKTYNIETALNLPLSEKEGYQFIGWYDNKELTGEPILEIEKGLTGNKEFYAKYEEVIEEIPSVDEVLLNGKNGDILEVEGIILGAGYDTDGSLSDIFFQDKYSGKTIIVKDLLGYKTDFNNGDLIKFKGEVKVNSDGEDNEYGMKSLHYVSDFVIVEENKGVLDYKNNAIEINSHADTLTYLNNDNRQFGAVYYFNGTYFINGTSSAGYEANKNLRFHLNDEASGANDIKYGLDKYLVLNIPSNEVILGEKWHESILGFNLENYPGLGYPGRAFYNGGFYAVLKNASNSYYYWSILKEEDIILEPANKQIERELKNAVPKNVTGGQIDLPVTHERLTENITWESNKPSIISTTGLVNPTNTDELVTLTAKYTIDANLYEVVIEVNVLSIKVQTVNQVLATAKDDEIVRVKGIVVGFHWDGSGSLTSNSHGLMIKDATGNKLLYVLGLHGNYGVERGEYLVDETHQLKLKDEIEFTARYVVSDDIGSAGRKTLIISTAASANMKVLRSNVSYSFDKTLATVIKTEENLDNLAENLEYGVMYKLEGPFTLRSSASDLSKANMIVGFKDARSLSSYNHDVTWANVPQRFTFKVDGNTSHLGNNWAKEKLGFIPGAYDGYRPYSYYDDSEIYFYVSNTNQMSSYAYVQLSILDKSHISTTLVPEAGDALRLNDDQKTKIRGYVLQRGYSESTSGASVLDTVYLQDRHTGKILVVTGLEDEYTTGKIKVADDIIINGTVTYVNGKPTFVYESGLEVKRSKVTLRNYQENAIEVTNHEEGLEEFLKDFNYGEIYKFTGRIFFNSTTSSGRVTNLRFHMNADPNSTADQIRYNGKGLVFNVDSNKILHGENFVEDLFGITGNPGVGRPGVRKDLTIYFVVKSESNSYYYMQLLNESDVEYLENDQIVKNDINAAIPNEIISGNIELPTTHALVDGPITWVSSNETVISNLGVVKYGDSDVDVDLTYTFKIGANSYSNTIRVKVLEQVPLSVANIITNSKDNDAVLVEGVVAGFHWNGSSTLNPESNGIILKDAQTNNDVLYVIGLYGNYGTVKGKYVVNGQTLAKGDKIRFAATYSLAKSVGHVGRKTLTIESTEAANLTVVSKGNALNYNLNAATEINKRADLEALAENLEYGKLYKLSGEFGFRGSASNWGTGVNLQTGFNVTGTSDVNFEPTWTDSRPQRFSFKFDNIAMNLGNNWYTNLLGINETNYTGTGEPYMNYKAGSYIYFYVGHAYPTASTYNGYIQLSILESSWVSATLK